MKHGERGSTIIESMFCSMLLILIGFGFLGIFQLFTTKITTDYAAYQVARARSLGYNDAIIQRVGQLAAAGVSGPDISGHPIRGIPAYGAANARSRDYLAYGWGPNNAYKVNFAFWNCGADPFSGPPLSEAMQKTSLEITLPVSVFHDAQHTSWVKSSVRFRNYPVALEVIYSWIGFPKDDFDTPASSVTLKNHSAAFLEDVQ